MGCLLGAEHCLLQVRIHALGPGGDVGGFKRRLDALKRVVQPLGLFRPVRQRGAVHHVGVILRPGLGVRHKDRGRTGALLIGSGDGVGGDRDIARRSRHFLQQDDARLDRVVVLRRLDESVDRGGAGMGFFQQILGGGDVKVPCLADLLGCRRQIFAHFLRQRAERAGYLVEYRHRHARHFHDRRSRRTSGFLGNILEVH